MRQPTTAEVRLMNTKQRVSAPRGRASCRFGCQRVGCDRILLPRNRKIATNNFGIREISVNEGKQPSSDAARRAIRSFSLLTASAWPMLVAPAA
jgi:hypothetical protein